MSKAKRQSPPKPAPAPAAKPAKAEKTERFLVQSRYSPRSEWKTEAQDAVVNGAISQGGEMSRRHESGTAEHRVYDTDVGAVIWERGYIETGVKASPVQQKEDK